MKLSVPSDAPLRLDVLLTRALDGMSRQRARELIAAGAVLVNGRPGRKGQLIDARDVVTIPEEPERGGLEPQPEIEISILFEDAVLVAINKPASIPAHALRSTDRGTAANF